MMFKKFSVMCVVACVVCSAALASSPLSLPTNLRINQVSSQGKNVTYSVSVTGLTNRYIGAEVTIDPQRASFRKSSCQLVSSGLNPRFAVITLTRGEVCTVSFTSVDVTNPPLFQLFDLFAPLV